MARALSVSVYAPVFVALLGCVISRESIDNRPSEPTSAGSTGGSSGPSSGINVPLAADEAEEVDAKTLGLTLSQAASFTERVRFTANRDSIVLYLPFLATAQDYRVFAVKDGVSTAVVSGKESVTGAVVFCAGLRQHNACDDSEAHNTFSATYFSTPKCSADFRAVMVSKEVLRQVQIDGLVGETTLVVEAVDTLCPFTGVIGLTAANVELSAEATQKVTTTVNGQSKQLQNAQDSFPIRTESEVATSYGSVFVNGQLPAPRPTTTNESPNWNLGQPGPATVPTVLARVVIKVKPKGMATPPTGFSPTDLFDDFSDDADQPVLQPSNKLVPNGFPVQFPTHYQTSKWNLYSFGAEHHSFFVRRGTLHSVLPDWQQDIMATNLMYPKQAYAMPAAGGSAYLHTTFEAPTDASDRRYFWFHVCGDSTAGKTFAGTALAERKAIVPIPFFFDPSESGASISLGGWNCLLFAPRGGGYEVLPGGLLHNSKLDGKARAETDIRIVINSPTTASSGQWMPPGNATLIGPPQQYPDQQATQGSWMRTFDHEKKLLGPILDDQMFVDQRTKFDVYINASRVVVYINGEQRVCNDFTGKPLTMAEAAIGLGHILYHSEAERIEFERSDWLRTAQYHYRYNTPWVDARTFDNVGVRASTTLPNGFDARPCYAYTGN